MLQELPNKGVHSLDGVAAAEGRLLFATTNHIEVTRNFIGSAGPSFNCASFSASIRPSPVLDAVSFIVFVT